MIKSRRWARHVARMGEKRNSYKFFVEKQGGNTTRKTLTWAEGYY
jgi:hypothetical protein